MIKVSQEKYRELSKKAAEYDALQKYTRELLMEIESLKKSKSKGVIHKASWTRENKEKNVKKDRGI